MHVSIAICTWNRAEVLDKTLTSMKELVTPHGVTWEVVVVNNHCTDGTDGVIQKHARYLPLRRLWEPRLGKSNALNAAIDSATGELILWTDDDVLIDRNWLASHVAAAERFPEASFFGGPIDPWFETDPPEWVTAAWEQVSTVYAARQFGDEVFECNTTTLPFGANFAIRTAVQRRYRYDCRLGRVGPSDVRGEETAVLEKMIADGLRGYWVPDARVQHLIPTERLTLDYIERFFFGIGVTAAVRAARSNTKRAKRRSRPAYLRFKVALYGAQYKLLRHVASPSSWIHKLARLNYYRGRLSHLTAPAAVDAMRKAA